MTKFHITQTPRPGYTTNGAELEQAEPLKPLDLTKAERRLIANIRNAKHLRDDLLIVFLSTLEVRRVR